MFFSKWNCVIKQLKLVFEWDEKCEFKERGVQNFDECAYNCFCIDYAIDKYFDYCSFY